MKYTIYPKVSKSLINVGYYIFSLDDMASLYEKTFKKLIFENMRFEKITCENVYIGIFNSNDTKFCDFKDRNTISPLTYVEGMYIAVVSPNGLNDMLNIPYLTFEIDTDENKETLISNYENCLTTFSGSISPQSKTINNNCVVYSFQLNNFLKFQDSNRFAFENMRFENSSVHFAELHKNNFPLRRFYKNNNTDTFFLPKEPFPYPHYNFCTFEVYCDKECPDIALQFDIPCSKTTFTSNQKIDGWGLIYDSGNLLVDEEQIQKNRTEPKYILPKEKLFPVTSETSYVPICKVVVN